MNIVGYFRDLEECDEYRVEIVKSGDTSSFVEFEMAGNQPFIVNYETSNTPFDPIRKSTASIIFVGSDFMDCVSSTPNGTTVKLYRNNVIEYAGYLKPYIQSQGWVRCEDNVSLECSDGLALLQYIKYHYLGNYKNIVSIKDILNEVCNKAGDFMTGYAFPETKLIGGSYAYPENFSISEQNFYTSDTDEPWTMYEVLEEICKYFGLTAIQYGTIIYFIDFGAEKVKNPTYRYYTKSSNYETYSTISTSYNTIEQDDIRGGGATLSWEQIYSKVSVRDSFYKPEYYTPDIFKDDYLTNVYSSAYPWTCRENKIVLNKFNLPIPMYINKEGEFAYDAVDSLYSYYNRRYINRYYSGIYYTSGLTSYTPVDMTDSALTRDYIGGTIVANASVENGLSGSSNYQDSANISFNKYLLISQMNRPDYLGDPRPAQIGQYSPVFKLNDNYTNPILHNGSDTYIVIDCAALFERYAKRDYINPDWTNEPSAANKHQTSSAGNTRPKLVFSLGVNGNWWNGSAWTDTETAFYVDAETGTWEEEYSVNGKKHKTEWFEGTNWNTDRNVLNNISWTDWVGLNGYKIPLDNVHNFYGPIQFRVHLPVKLMSYFGPHEEDITMNSYCYLKDLSVKIANKGSENTENDLVINNVISGVMENEMSEIVCKITTFDEKGGLSYSNIAYNGELLSTIKDVALSNYQKPEENLIERLVNQYSTPTIKLDLTLTNNYNALNRITDIDLEEYSGKVFAVMGQKIDYRAGSQEINIIELK